MAAVGGVSLGRAMGDWLESTMDGAQFVTREVHNAKELPKLMQRELMTRLGVNVDKLAAGVLSGAYRTAWDSTVAGAGERSEHGPAAGDAPAPSSNTGLNLRKSRSARKP